MNEPPAADSGKHERALQRAEAMLLSLRQEITVPSADRDWDDGFACIPSQLDEVADIMLDLKEPKRTEVFRIYLALRETVEGILCERQSKPPQN